CCARTLRVGAVLRAGAACRCGAARGRCVSVRCCARALRVGAVLCAGAACRCGAARGRWTFQYLEEQFLRAVAVSVLHSAGAALSVLSQCHAGQSMHQVPVPRWC
ncbi:hypothetical protein chiPu_0030182, partial [Chiloscyllium punctatum]|nr:hypothetical protein [Chiloscyllium punctatum]